MTEPEARPKILFFAPILEYPPAGGPPLSVVNAVKVLSRLGELHIVTTVPEWTVRGTPTETFFRANSHALSFAPSHVLASRNRTRNRVINKLRRILAPAVAIPDVRYVLDYGRRHGIDVYWIDRVLERAFFVFHGLRRRLPQARIVGDTEAVHSRFVLREIPLIANPLRRALVARTGRRIESQERELVATANAVTAVSDVDADYYRAIAPDPSRIRRFSNVVDLADFEDAEVQPFALNQPAVILLGVYGQASSPMDRAAEWTAREIMPLVWQKVPQAHLYIVGRRADRTQAHQAGPNVTVVGQVPSVMPYLKQAAVSLVPLRYESGTRFKIVESGAAALPTVSTTLGAEGLQVTDGKDILIADDTQTFAQAIVRVLTDPELARSLGRELHAMVARTYSLGNLRTEGETILRAVLARRT
ncbi:MAG TPA: glycosyltransferase family 4 protein [Rhizomicrobium sp.]|nr:glycosyltransferase family 4 protein [Rhizomicrobium sp.]